MLDAVAAVQRHSPRFVISDVSPPAHWSQMGALYLCRQQKTVADMDDLSKDPTRPDPRWTGVVCFKGTADPNQLHVPWIAEGGDRCLIYDTFAVFGDAEVLQEVQTILAAEGFHIVRKPLIRAPDSRAPRTHQD
jgi:hypothetical protein